MRVFSTVILLIAAIVVTTSVSAQMIPFGFWQPQSSGGLCPSGGVSYNGYCYYTGGDRQDCNSYCISIGKTCDATGTQAASNATNCVSVAGALGWEDPSGGPYTAATGLANTAGCYQRTFYSGPFGEEELRGSLRYGTSTQVCTTPPPGSVDDELRTRACACN
jgi:hypothetical protein